MGSSYWPRPELSNPNTQRYYSQLPNLSSPIGLSHALSAIVEDQEPDSEPNLPSITGQPTTSAIRAPRSSYNSLSTPVAELEASFHKERDSNCAMSAPSKDYNLQQTFLKRHRLAMGTCFPIFYAITLLLMLVYFVDQYLTLPRRSPSQLPRIAPQYSIWPYISCMGSLNLIAFKVFAFLIAFFFCATFAFDLYISLHAHPGYWLRRLLIPLSLLWSALFIWLVFADKDANSHLHLYIVSVKLFTSLAIKTMSYFTGHQMRRRYPVLKNDHVALITYRWKQLILLCAFPLAILANLGIYACMDPTEIQTPGTTCYIIVAIAAGADWAYALVDISFVLNLAYDIHHHDRIEAATGVDDQRALADLERHTSVGEV